MSRRCKPSANMALMKKMIEDAAVQDADVSDEVKRQLAEIDALARSQHRVPL